jgi:hypothetical protein
METKINYILYHTLNLPRQLLKISPVTFAMYANDLGPLSILSYQNISSEVLLRFGISLFALSLLFVVAAQRRTGNAAFDAPIIGTRWSWLERVRFLTDGSRLLQQGFNKVGFFS